MTHDWLIFALGIILSVLGWLILRAVGHIDALEKELGDKASKDDLSALYKALENERSHTNRHSEEIRDTRSAIARIEGKLDLPPFPYSTSGD